MTLTIADLIERWDAYTPRGLRKVRKRPDFPPPVAPRRWSEADIAAYEKAYPELLSRPLKVRKVIGYFRAVQKGG